MFGRYEILKKCMRTCSCFFWLCWKKNHASIITQPVNWTAASELDSSRWTDQQLVNWTAGELVSSQRTGQPVNRSAASELDALDCRWTGQQPINWTAGELDSQLRRKQSAQCTLTELWKNSFCSLWTPIPLASGLVRLKKTCRNTSCSWHTRICMDQCARVCVWVKNMLLGGNNYIFV